MILLTSGIRRPSNIFISVDNSPGFKSILATPDEDMLDAIASLKAQGLKVALLTNNWKSKSGGKAGRLLFDGLEMFDEVRMSDMMAEPLFR